MIKTLAPIHGHKRLNCFSTVVCDKCGEDCTNKFFDVFINGIIHTSTTGSYPFGDIDKINKQYCSNCINELCLY